MKPTTGATPVPKTTGQPKMDAAKKHRASQLLTAAANRDLTDEELKVLSVVQLAEYARIRHNRQKGKKEASEIWLSDHSPSHLSRKCVVSITQVRRSFKNRSKILRRVVRSFSITGRKSVGRCQIGFNTILITGVAAREISRSTSR